MVERTGAGFALEQQAWGDVYAQLSAADRSAPLALDDLERLAVAAYLIGRDRESEDAWTRAHQEAQRHDDVARAVRCAFWVAFGLLNKGELARGSGWVDRAQRLLDDGRHDCVEQGYLRYCVAFRCVLEGDATAGHASFSQAAKIGDRFRDAQLMTLARVGQGRCLIYLGEIAEGMALLDEAMVSVTAREVSAIAVGDVYCTMIEACQELFDLGRVQEWTAALSDWCESQPQLVLYRGQCLVHRAEIMQLSGRWSEAMDEVQRACARLAQPAGQPAHGAAVYLRAELHRLRGEFVPSEAAYREASELGREPQPGLAQLRLAQGQLDAAAAAIRRVLDEAQDPMTRARVLGPYVEIVLAEGDVGAARVAADELSAIAAELNAPFLHALAAHTVGVVLLAENDYRPALASLRDACAVWRELDAEHETARVRMLIGLACRALKDADGAAMEFEAARGVFARLGAAPDLVRMDELCGPVDPPRTAGGLTARELQVLELVAAGKSNRSIGDDLVISEKTVARHVSNIFTKLGLSSRAAATAYAYEHDLV
jgi:ATP/maltotriose-dependent transcriptional regulator MalT